MMKTCFTTVGANKTDKKQNRKTVRKKKKKKTCVYKKTRKTTRKHNKERRVFSESCKFEKPFWAPNVGKFVLYTIITRR